MKAGDIVVYGTNIAGKEISETFTLTDDDTAVDAGTKAFKTVTSIVIPAQEEHWSHVHIRIRRINGSAIYIKRQTSRVRS